MEEVAAVLQGARFKLMTVTQVDTSTGVLADVKGLAALASQHGTLLVVDGVCSVAGEELRMTEWGVDVALTARKKPQRATRAALLSPDRGRWKPSTCAKTLRQLYAIGNCLPIMQAYKRARRYFVTPRVNLVWA